jgi:membrane protease YdiL (CAAX protease family)
MVTLLRRLTLDQWRALDAQYPREAESEAESYRVLGLYLIAGLVLFFNRFYAWDSFGWLSMDGLFERPKVWNRIFWAVAVSAAYFGPPAMYAKLVLKRDLRSFGFRGKGLTEHVPLYIFFFGLVFPFVVVLSGTEHFMGTYPLARQAGLQWETLIAWELAYALQFLTLEFFFRGFLLFGPVKTLGRWVVPMMVVPYLMLHFQKPPLEAIGSIIAGTALGIVALRTRSIYAGMIIHIAVAWSMDGLAMWHRGDLPRLLGMGAP